MDGGPGSDWVSYHYAPAPVNVDLGGQGVASGWGSTRRSRGRGPVGLAVRRPARPVDGRANPLRRRAVASIHLESRRRRHARREGRRHPERRPGPDRPTGGPGVDRLNGGPGRDRCSGERKRNCPVTDRVAQTEGAARRAASWPRAPWRRADPSGDLIEEARALPCNRRVLPASRLASRTGDARPLHGGAIAIDFGCPGHDAASVR